MNLYATVVETRAGLKTIIVWLTCCAYLLSLSGCSTTRQLAVEPNDVQTLRDGRVISVISKNGEVIKFNSDGGHLIEQTRDHKIYRSIIGVTDDARNVELVPDSLLQVKVEQSESNTVGTAVVVGLVTAAVAFGVLVVIVAVGLNHN